jgi:hypothetical protein
MSWFGDNIGAIGGGLAGSGFGAIGSLIGAQAGSNLQNSGSLNGAGQASPYGYMIKPQQPQFQSLQSVPQDTQGLNAYQSRALSQGPSPWANLALQKQGINQQQLQEQGAQGFAGQLAQARSNLASKGGLRSGAAENLARDAARGQEMNSAAIARQGASDQLGILTQDQQMKDQFLRGLPGEQRAQTSLYAGLRQGDNTNAQNAYQTAMEGYAADQGANAYWQQAQQNRPGLIGQALSPITGLFKGLF